MNAKLDRSPNGVVNGWGLKVFPLCLPGYFARAHVLVGD
jgi:hypothetical protein